MLIYILTNNQSCGKMIELVKYAGISVLRTSKERKRSLGNASQLAGIGSFENERA